MDSTAARSSEQSNGDKIDIKIIVVIIHNNLLDLLAE